MAKVRTLEGGFPTTITLSAGTGPAVTFEEITVQPPGLDGGEPIDTTTMRNTAYRTKAPRALIEGTNGDMTVAYKLTAYDSIKAQIKLNQLIVITFPDTGTLTFWGYLKTFTPDGLEQGKRPTAKITIVPTFTDNSGAEVAPVVVAGVGTGVGG